MNKKVCAAAALIADLAIIVFTIHAISGFFVGTGDQFMNVAGFVCFRYFTIDSNVLAAIACCAAIPSKIRALMGRPAALSRPLLLLKHAGTAAVTVTLLTVLFFLGPTMGYGAMFVGPSFWLHGVNPVLAILVFVLADGNGLLRLRDWPIGALPVAVYACFYVPLAVFTHVWPDFYGFNVGGLWYVSAPVMLAAANLISLGLYAAQRLVVRRAGSAAEAR